MHSTGLAVTCTSLPSFDIMLSAYNKPLSQVILSTLYTAKQSLALFDADSSSAKNFVSLISHCQAYECDLLV